MKLLFRVFTVCLATAVAAGSCSDEPSSFKMPALRCPDHPTMHPGEATFYRGADGTGSCSFDSSGDVMIGAMNIYDYEGSRLCGAWVQITGPESTIHVRIVDSCPECSRGDIDLSPEAFSMIADTSLGRVAITWSLLPFPVQGPISYRFKDSINYWWSAVQIRNHRYPIFSVEFRSRDGTFHHLTRAPYNYFTGYMNMGTDPFTFRVTDVNGHVLVDSGIVPVFNADIQGKSQFPLCAVDTFE